MSEEGQPEPQGAGSGELTEATEEGPTRLRIDVPPSETSASTSTLPAEAARHQREIEKLRLEHDQKKELREMTRQIVGQSIAMVLVVVIGLGCLWVIVSNKYPATTVDKASAALLLIVGGFVGFITGQATKK